MVRQERRTSPAWARRGVAVSLALLALFFLLPLLMLPDQEKPDLSPVPTAVLPIMEDLSLPAPAEAAATPIPGWDSSQSIRLLRSDGTVETLTLEDYLWGVTAAEMPASFQEEALKAQAVCARTYCVHQIQSAPDKHPNADVCADYTCCQAYLTREQAAQGWGEEAQRYGDKITAAVQATDVLLCLYGGHPIDAVFFSSSAGRTSAAAEVWGADVPYLTAVDSPEGEEVPGWQTVVTFTAKEFADRFTLSCPQADFSAPPTNWIRDLETDDSGLVKWVTIGEVRVTGGQARTILGLRSAHFTAQADEGEITLYVTGYGHGVGLSQYGANALAEQGKDFVDILEWYYTGIRVSGLET